MTNPFASLDLEPTGKQSPHEVKIGLVSESGRYRIGPAVRPPIKHDNGHLDMYKQREPTAADRVKLARWIAMLEGSEALCNAQTGKFVPACNGEDLSDGNAAYRHFLFGNGADRTFNYERFLQNDPAAKNLVQNLINDFQYHVSIIGKDRVKFSVTSLAYTVGTNGIAPYPATSNWQKAIGGHFLWLSADVKASATGDKIYYDADITIHVEDRFNFNPGAADVATGILDSENGLFEITGLGKQYTNYATVTRHTRWEDGSAKEAQTTNAPSDRQRMPSDNRRLRNRM